MPKPYLNHGLIGNGRTLGCLTDRGEMIRLFWPHPDRWQMLDKLVIGIYEKTRKNSVRWLHEDGFTHTQNYQHGTAILRTLLHAQDKSLEIEQDDFVAWDRDTCFRSFIIKNTSQAPLELGAVVFMDIPSAIQDYAGVMFDFERQMLVGYRPDRYLGIQSGCRALGFQLGNQAFSAACFGELHGHDAIGMMKEGAVQFDLGNVVPGGHVHLDLRLLLDHTLNGLRKQSSEVLDIKNEIHACAAGWKGYMNRTHRMGLGREDVAMVYERSLVAFRLLQDAETGGLMAAPEIDEEFTRSGRYAYCWARDAAFITDAMDACGLHAEVEKFYHWAVRCQCPEGSWAQRHHLDGNLAPSWGMQVDETGTILFGMLQHYKRTGNKEFLKEVWPSVKSGADFLTRFVDHDTGLPYLSFDLWEERLGEHAYSTAAVIAGLRAATVVAEELGESAEPGWNQRADGMYSALEWHFWRDDAGRYIRSIRVKLNAWGGEHSQHTTVLQVNPMGYRRDFTNEDWTLDASLMGLAIPFGVMPADAPRFRATLEAIERELSCHETWGAGLMRYSGDSYVGGNPWILTTLWAALCHFELGDTDSMRETFDWAVRGRTDLGFLPEQIGRYDGKPAWVIPLTWSHAMFVLMLEKLGHGH